MELVEVFEIGSLLIRVLQAPNGKYFVRIRDEGADKPYYDLSPKGQGIVRQIARHYRHQNPKLALALGQGY